MPLLSKKKVANIIKEECAQQLFYHMNQEHDNDALGNVVCDTDLCVLEGEWRWKERGEEGCMLTQHRYQSPFTPDSMSTIALLSTQAINFRKYLSRKSRSRGTALPHRMKRGVLVIDTGPAHLACA